MDGAACAVAMEVVRCWLLCGVMSQSGLVPISLNNMASESVKISSVEPKGCVSAAQDEALVWRPPRPGAVYVSTMDKRRVFVVFLV